MLWKLTIGQENKTVKVRYIFKIFSKKNYLIFDL